MPGSPSKADTAALVPGHQCANMCSHRNNTQRVSGCNIDVSRSDCWATCPEVPRRERLACCAHFRFGLFCGLSVCHALWPCAAAADGPA